MKTSIARVNIPSTAVAIFLLALMAGCDKTGGPSATEPILEEDIASTIATSMSEEGGGMADQLDDIAYLAGGGGFRLHVFQESPLFSQMDSTVVDTVYDAGTGWWTATVTRIRSSEFGLYEASFTRVYMYQFLNSAGVAQRWYVTPSGSGMDTARTINFNIVSGTGLQRSPFHVHVLESMSAALIITNAHQPVVLVNGTYTRTGKDTLTTRQSIRTHANTLTAALINVTKPRYRPDVRRDSLSGTITGTVHSVVTFTKGDLYRERVIDKEFTIELTGTDARIGVGGKMFLSGWRRGSMRGRMW